jgi:hypothetical protein
MTELYVHPLLFGVRCAHYFLEVFHNVKSDFKCVIVGDSPYAEERHVKSNSFSAADSESTGKESEK